MHTTDRTLRSGRAAWAFVVSHFDQLPDVSDPCPTLDAWRHTGYDPKRAPRVSPAALQAFDKRAGRTVQRKVDAAARRMQQLGVPRRDAHRFTGDPMFRGLTPDLQTSSGSGSAGPPPV